MAVKALIPILNTTDIAALATFLTEKLGFAFQWDVKADDGVQAVYAGVGYEGIDAHLQLAETTPKDMQLYIYVDDVDAVYADVRARGADAEPPKDQVYGMRDFSVTGPEGTLIGFGADIAA